MPSPFPGMDPYLEAPPFWADLHFALIMALKADLKKRLPARYSVWADQYIWLHEPDAETRRGKPDVFVAERPHHPANGGTMTVTAPATAILPAVRREGNKYLKIKETRSERVVTVLELLSPSNKAPGDDREAYLAKRNEYLATGTNLVEIDLLRSGERMPMGEPAPPLADYYIVVCCAADFPKTAIWPFSLRDPMPPAPVPLKPEDGWIEASLQDCFNWAYDQGPYSGEVEYGEPPAPPLSAADAEWARHLLQHTNR